MRYEEYKRRYLPETKQLSPREFGVSLAEKAIAKLTAALKKARGA